MPFADTERKSRMLNMQGIECMQALNTIGGSAFFQVFPNERKLHIIAALYKWE